jgi:hypothetical protein
MKRDLFLAAFFIMLFICSCETAQGGEESTAMMDQKIAKFVRTNIAYDENLLDDREKIVVNKLFQAAKLMDEIFLDQVYSANRKIKQELEQSSGAADRETQAYFNIMFGPFDRLDHNKPFYGFQAKPAGANFYPEDMTKEEFLQWLTDHPQDEAAFTSEFTVIRRKDGGLAAIPYSEFYKDRLAPAAQLLREAAEYADNASLKRYLQTRAEAFLSNDYYESDMAWMDLKDHKIEVVIGPYEVYEDELFNYKASFECFLTVVDPVESGKLKIFGSYLTDIEKNLPYPDQYKNFNRGGESPIAVVQEVFSAGDTKAGVQTLAFNLPNDERVREAKGSKKVMLKNIHEAKFEKLLKPIAALVIDEAELKHVTFDAFFNHTLMHEISHGVGPGLIEKEGKKVDVKKELKETYSKLEECKADVLGLYNNLFMIRKGVFPPQSQKDMLVTFLAGIFRSIRFGISEAHGGGNAIIYNYLLENGAYQFDAKQEKLRVNYDLINEKLSSLANKILVIQATGDYEGAKALIARYGVETPTMTTLRNKLNQLPVDIWPVFSIESKMQ